MSSDDAEKWEAKLDTPLPGMATRNDDDMSGTTIITEGSVNSY